MSNQPTVYEQQLIRDQGEDFRNRVKKAIKKFEPLNQSLSLSIRNLIKDMIQEILQIEPDQSLINNFYFRYFTRYEDQHFRFMMQSLNYIFDQERVFDFNDDLNYKYIAIIFVEQIRAYLKEQNDKNLNHLWNKLNSIKKQKETDELEEGFHDDFDNENGSMLSKKSRMGKNNKQDNENEFCHTRKEMQLKDMLIQSLQTKLFQRENNLVQITSGYLKELQTLREQLFRRDQHLINSDELFEVNFMDFTEVLEPNIKKLLHGHIVDLKLQFNNRMIAHVKLNQAQKEEIRNHKIQIQKLNNQLHTIDGPSELLKKLFLIENNPYRIWKYIADAKGNFFFKEVFEQQKAVFGINYQEVNQLLMTNKAYEREYQNYKEQTLQEQLNVFKTIQAGIEELKQKQVKMEQENQILVQERQLDQLRFIEISTKNYEEKVKQEIEIMKEYYQTQVSDLKFQIIALDKLKIKYAFKLWVAIAKIHRPEDILKVLKEAQFFDDKLKSFEAKNRELENLFQFEKNINKTLIAKQSVLEFEIEKNSKELKVLRNSFKYVEQNRNELENELKSKEKEYTLLNSFTTKMVRLIDQRLSQVKILDINLEDRSKEIVKGFIKAIRELNLKSLRAVEEVRRQGELNLSVYQAMTEKMFKNQEVQTDKNSSQLKTAESVDEESKKQHQSMIKKSSNYNSEDSKQKQSQKLDLNSDASQNKSSQKQKSQKQIDEPKNNKPKLIISSPQENSDDGTQKQQDYEDQSTRLSPLKVLQNFDYKSVELQKKASPVQSTATKNQNKFQLYQDYQSEQVIQLLEVSEQVEQEQVISSNQHKSQSQSQEKSFSSQNNKKQQNKNFNRDQLCYTSVQQQRKVDEKQSQSFSSTRAGIRSYRVRATSQQQQAQTSEVFEKLYADSHEKSQRIKNLKENLEMLEKCHWDDILDVFSQQPSGNYILKHCLPPKVKDSQFQFLETESFLKNKNKKYYDRTKSKTPSKERYKSWIMKQTNCIDKMFSNLDTLSTIKERREQEIFKASSLNYSTLVPDHIFNIKKKINV